MSLFRRRSALHVLMSRPLWSRRLWFLFGAIVVGLSAVAFALAATWANAVFKRLLAWNELAPLIVTPLGFALIIFVTRRWVPAAEGSGIPQTIAALSANEARRAELLPLRVALGKMAFTIIGLLAGASIGREGPSVQVGASIMYALSRSAAFPYERMQRGLILAGGAAGVAAAFNAPLAGVVFAIEEMSRSFEQRTISIVITAVIVSGVVSLGLLGDYTYFGKSSVTVDLASGWRAVAVLGLVGGLLGGLFSQVLILLTVKAPQSLRAWRGERPVLFAALCGLSLAGLGLASAGGVYGTGYDEAQAIVHGDHVAYALGPLKMGATLVSYLSGIPGGIFAPSLSVGACLGGDLGFLLPGVPIAAIALLGMVGYFSGVVQAPLTAFVIVLEMTKDSQMALPLMACALIAYAVSRLICPHGLYEALARAYT